MEQLINAGIKINYTDGKIRSLYFPYNCSLTDVEAWELVDAAGLRYVPPEPTPYFPPDWDAFYELFEDSEIEQAIAISASLVAAKQFFFTKLGIEFGKRGDGSLSVDRVIKYWNSAVSESTLTAEQRSLLNQWAEASHLPVICNTLNQLELKP